MACKLCARFWARLWEKSDAWDRAASNESELWAEEPVRNRELIDRAHAIQGTDPAAAFALFLEAAEAGSAHAAEAVAWHYQTGAVVSADFGKAQDYFCRAIDAGSWLATLSYAQFLADHGFHDDCETLLKGGVEAGFVPSHFWLAYLRYRRCRSRAVAREVRPMLEYAAGKGHPMAQVYLARLMTLGNFGLREIPLGVLSIVRMACRDASNAEKAAPKKARAS